MNEENTPNPSAPEPSESAAPAPASPLGDLKVLIVEDSKIEAKFIATLLKKNGYNVITTRVETEGEMRQALDDLKWDIIISDYQMPDFDGMRALQVFQERQMDIPFILVSGKIGEEMAVDLMKMGAHDYIMKGNTARLVPAIKAHLQEAANRRDRKRLEKALRESEAQYRGFFQNARIGIFRTTQSGALIDANARMADAFGYANASEFIKTHEALRPEIFDTRTRQARVALLNEMAENSTQFEAVFHRKDGSILEANVNVWSIQEDPDKPVFLEGTVEDITERKALERRIREMEQMNESIIDLTSNL